MEPLRNANGETGDEPGNWSVDIRPFLESDANEVRELFIAVNRALATEALRDAFEDYISRSRKEEIDRIQSYYEEKEGGFWVGRQTQHLVGMFGLERKSPKAMELRRMYVHPMVRRRGIGRRLLSFAEQECRRRGISKLELSTAEIQRAAIALYQGAGYQLVHSTIATRASNRTVGHGLRRYGFEKWL